MDNIKSILNTVLISLMFVLANSASANEPNVPQIKDSIQLNELVVTGTMPSVNLRNVPMSITVVNSKQIIDRIEPSLLPLLTEEVPGLFITQRGAMGYGVSNGSAGSMNIRGVGGAPTSGVLILIDGHPQYMGLMGHPLADSYQSAMTERVEVVRGPASVLYGSNAMGGVINIITKKQKQNGLRQSSQVMYGSYNTLAVDLSTHYKKDRFFGDIDLGYNRSDGHRQNMEFKQLNLYAKAGYEISNNWTTFADFNISETKSSNPGTSFKPIEDNDADITRGVASIAIENRYDKASGTVRFYYNFGTHHINDGYSEGEKPKEHRFHSNDDMMGFSANQSFSPFYGNITTAGIDYQRFGGKAFNRFPDSNNDIELIDTHLSSLAGFINTQQSIIDNKLTINAGIRLDNNSNNGSEWVPQFGVSYVPTSTTTIKAIASKGFRTPTIREMYMFPPQNPNLLAERLMNYEVSLMQSLLGGKLNLGLNLFYIEGDNIIQTIMVDGKPLNTNSGIVDNKGVEVSSNYQVLPNLKINANYSYLNMKHKIEAAPEHKLYISGAYSINRWQINSGLQYINNLYTSIKPEVVTENFWLWNARVRFKLNKCIDLFVKVDNILNQKYEINNGFEMPGTTAFAGFRFSI